jgi:hypothetical protein
VTTTSARTRRSSDWTLVDHSLSVKVKLAGLWTAMMLLYVYADILSFYRPGEIADIESGELGPFDVSQPSLVIASVIVIVPTLMIALSLMLRASLGGRGGGMETGPGAQPFGSASDAFGSHGRREDPFAQLAGQPFHFGGGHRVSFERTREQSEGRGDRTTFGPAGGG